VFSLCNRAAAVAAYMPSSRFFERNARLDLDRKDFAIFVLCGLQVVAMVKAEIKKKFNRSLNVTNAES